MFRLFWAAVAAIVITPSASVAQDVRITPDTSSYTIDLNGRAVTISRNQDQTATIAPEFAKTSRSCPPFCIHPAEAAPGVETIAELEVIDFLESYVAAGRGILIDSRVPEWFAKGTIPGAVNVPFSTLEPTNPYRDAILQAFGAVKAGNGWDFSGATELALFCNGPWCDQSPRSIRSLVDLGYPVEKLRYYRGGMQDWLMLGLTTESPSS